MQKVIYLIVSVFIITSFLACKKSNQNNNSSTANFDIISSDSLVFTKRESKLFHFKISPSSTSIFDVSFTLLPTGFQNNTSGILTDSNGQYAIIQFNKHGVSPGSYPATMKITERNNLSNFQSKNILLQYKPNCAYDYINYKNSELNYVMAGVIQNSAITCDYNDNGQLVVKGLSLPYDLTLTIDCNNNSLVMSTVQTDAFTYHTGTGTLSNGLIYISIKQNGTLFANIIIKP